jgi:hypothetical protein
MTDLAKGAQREIEDIVLDLDKIKTIEVARALVRGTRNNSLFIKHQPGVRSHPIKLFQS